MLNFSDNEDLCKLGKEYLNGLLCKFGPFCLQHSKTFDISHAFLWVTIAELSMLKQVRFFGPPCIYSAIFSPIYIVMTYWRHNPQNRLKIFCFK